MAISEKVLNRANSFLNNGFLQIIKDPVNLVEVLIKENGNQLLMVLFTGKGVKPYWYFSAKIGSSSVSSLWSQLASSLKSHYQICAINTEQAALRAAANALPHNVLIGDIFCCSWGWEQTNVYYYQVVALRGKKTLTVHEIRAEKTYTGDMSGYCTPIKDAFKGDQTLDVIVKRDDTAEAYFKLDYGTAHRKDATEQARFSEYA